MFQRFSEDGETLKSIDNSSLHIRGGKKEKTKSPILKAGTQTQTSQIVPKMPDPRPRRSSISIKINKEYSTSSLEKSSGFKPNDSKFVIKQVIDTDARYKNPNNMQNSNTFCAQKRKNDVKIYNNYHPLFEITNINTPFYKQTVEKQCPREKTPLLKLLSVDKKNKKVSNMKIQFKQNSSNLENYQKP